MSADPIAPGMAVVGMDLKDGSPTELLIPPSSNPAEPTETCTAATLVKVLVGSTGDVNLDGRLDEDLP